MTAEEVRKYVLARYKVGDRVVIRESYQSSGEVVRVCRGKIQRFYPHHVLVNNGLNECFTYQDFKSMASKG